MLLSTPAFAAVPTASDDGPFVAPEGGSVVGGPNVLTNDSDSPDNDPFTAVLGTGPSNASSFLLNPDGTFSYIHDGSETSSDSFTYTANDAEGASNVATVTLSITAVNDQPVITGQVPLSTPEETGLAIALVNLTVTDPDNTYPTDFALNVQDGTNYTRVSNTITPVTDFNGDLTVPVTVTDNSGEGNATSAVFNLTVSVTAVNDQPEITGQGAISTPEATARTILLSDLIVTDPDNAFPADFTLSVQNGTNYTRVGNEITPTADFNGNLSVPVTVTDNSGAGNATSAVFNLTVSVTGVNDQPVITGQVPLSTPEETGLAIALGNLSVTDPDNTYPADFALNVQDGTNYTRVSNTITPVTDFNGDLTVPVTVTDNSGEGNATSAVFNLTVSVTAVNDQPEITGQGAISTPEATARTILLSDLIVTDPDNAFPADFTLSVQNGTNYTRVGNEITPAADFNGNLSVPVTVTDNSGAGNATSAVFNLTVSVSAVNNQPVITGQGPLSTPEETALALSPVGLTIVDADSTVFTLTVQDGTNYTRVGNTVTPVTDFNGDLTVPVTVTDDSGAGNATSAPFNLTVSVTAANDQPVITGQGPLSTPEETQLVITLGDLTVTDPDSTVFTLAVQNGTNYTRVGNEITPVADFNGDLAVPVTVTDDSGAGNATSAAFNLTVSVSGVNDQPAITGQSVLSTPEETGLAITLGDLTVSDPDNAFPADFVLNVQNGTNYTQVGNTITPVADFNGDLTVPVTVTDNSGAGNATSAPFNLTVSVTAVNDQPVITGQGSIVTLEVTSRTILLTDLIVTDPDSTVFTLAVQDGIDYTRVGNTITPAIDFNGDLTVPVTVNDGTTNSPVFNLTVIVTAVNNQPQITGQVLLSTPEETALTIAVTDLIIVDADSTFPIDFTLSVQDGTDYTWVGNAITPVVDFNGVLAVPVTVSDGTDISPIFNLTVTVTAINDQPVITGQVVVTTPEVTARTIVLTDLIVTDPDSTVFTLAVQDGIDYTRVGNTITPATDFNGDLTVPVTVTDDSGEPNATSAVFNLTVSVSAVNNQPLITAQVPLSTPEETSLTITLTDISVTDVDNLYPDDFTLSVQDGTNYTRVGNTITPVTDFNDDLTVPVTVTDNSGEGNATSAVFNLTVSVTAVNDQPVITGAVSLSTPEDSSLTILVTDLTIFDPDNVFPDDFTLVLLDGLNYTRTGNTITPLANFNGPLSVPATVSDGVLTSTQFILTVDVSAENDEPVVVAPIETEPAVEGTAFSLNVFANFTDADNDVLEFAASGLPASGNLSFDPQTGVFSGTPRVEDARDNDPYIIIVTATDNQPGTIPAQTEFDLNILALDRANVSLDIVVAPDPAMLNDELRWTFTARNTVGPQPVTNVALTGSFVGSGLSISSTSSCTIQATVGQVTEFDCTLGNLPVGASTTVILTTLTSTPGDVVVFGTAATTNADSLPLDPILDDNSSQIAVGVAEAFSLGAVQVLGNSNVRSIAAGDVNGDGMADLVVGTAAIHPVQIYLSGGFRDFAASPIALADNSENEGVALADFDGNGTLDLVVANGGGQPDGVNVYSNDGVGNFTPMAALEATFSQDVAVGDFDNDGIMDVVFATIMGNPVYLGDGLGGFVLDATLGTANSHAVAVGRFDGDARDDVVFANTGGDSQVWIKNSGAGFSAGTQLTIGDAVSVTVGEFGGDMRPDLAFGRIPTGTGDVPSNPVFINDGVGGFGSPVAMLGISPTNDIHAGDVNRDGLTDLVFVNASGVHQIWTATGSGFELHREQIVDADSTVGVLTELGMTDVGDAGGVDLAMGGAVVSGLGIFLNDGFGNLGFGDAVSPVLTLVGQAAVSVPSGSAYLESGATAQDNIDGDISGSVVTTGAVNTAVVGDYVVTYNVVDRAGNDATPITRTVTVTPAAGTGGGGGGALSSLVLFLLTIGVCLSVYLANRAIIPAGDKNVKLRGTENA